MLAYSRLKLLSFNFVFVRIEVLSSPDFSRLKEAIKIWLCYSLFSMLGSESSVLSLSLSYRLFSITSLESRPVPWSTEFWDFFDNRDMIECWPTVMRCATSVICVLFVPAPVPGCLEALNLEADPTFGEWSYCTSCSGILSNGSFISITLSWAGVNASEVNWSLLKAKFNELWSVSESRILLLWILVTTLVSISAFLPVDSFVLLLELMADLFPMGSFSFAYLIVGVMSPSRWNSSWSTD